MFQKPYKRVWFKQTMIAQMLQLFVVLGYTKLLTAKIRGNETL